MTYNLLILFSHLHFVLNNVLPLYKQMLACSSVGGNNLLEKNFGTYLIIFMILLFITVPISMLLWNLGICGVIFITVSV